MLMLILGTCLGCSLMLPKWQWFFDSITLSSECTNQRAGSQLKSNPDLACVIYKPNYCLYFKVPILFSIFSCSKV